MPYPPTKAQPFEVEVDRSVLVIVDMQNDFVREGAPLETPDARATIETHVKLINAARSQGIPVVFTRFLAGPEYTLMWEWSPMLGPETKCCWLGHRRYYSDIDAEAEAAEVVDELPREPEDTLVDKYGYNAFFRTNLADRLTSLHRDMPIITGTVTQICVEDTVRGAFHHGLPTIVVSDAVSSFDPELHAASLRNIEMKYGRVLTSDQVLDSWSK
jgi:nicotinamidase-related amidase